MLYSTKKEETKSLRRAVMYLLLTVVLIVGFIFIGVPALTKLAVLFGDLKKSPDETKVEDENILPPSLESSFEATNSAQFRISGLASPEQRVSLFLNGSEISQSGANTEGKFAFENIQLIPGPNALYAIVVDNDKQSKPSNSIAVLFDDQSPTLTVSDPSDEQNYYYPAQNIQIKGGTEPGVTLRVNNHIVVLGNDGKFSYPYRLPEGSSSIKITASDSAGNSTEVNLSVKYNP